ncbi:exopolyphosphatase [Nocardia sp. NPDC058658]|uniref:Ppx/GppA phosphatase family protein n=1 Tax=Nocardia sp. NPDC058658 TaxID=3346580 RepID=UPI00365C6972
MSERIAAIDCGTNSIRLLIAEVGADGGLTDVHREMRIVRLGQGVDATGRLAPEALDRTRRALGDYVSIMSEHEVSRVRMVATSATRDAENRDEFFEMTRSLLGLVVPGAVAEVISGDEEARLSFAGAVGELSADAGPFVVVDLGGGSTELVVGDENGVQAAYSADIGCVRITERCLPGNPPTPEQITAAREFAQQKLDEAFQKVPVDKVHTWVGVAGTMTTITAVALDLPEYDSTRVHLTRLSLAEVHQVCDRLVAMNHDERAALGPMHPGRVDVIGGGAVITEVLADELARRAGVSELVVSEHDILDGIAMSIVNAA